MLKAVHASEDTQAALEKAKAVTRKLKEKKLKSEEGPGSSVLFLRYLKHYAGGCKAQAYCWHQVGMYLNMELLTEMKINREYAA